MAKDIHHIVATYDIHDPERLIKVAKVMKNYGERVLKSVFECNISPQAFESLKARVEKTIDHMEDSVRYYDLCETCLKSLEISGLGQTFIKDEPFVIA